MGNVPSSSNLLYASSASNFILQSGSVVKPGFSVQLAVEQSIDIYLFSSFTFILDKNV